MARDGRNGDGDPITTEGPETKALAVRESAEMARADESPDVIRARIEYEDARFRRDTTYKAAQRAHDLAVAEREHQHALELRRDDREDRDLAHRHAIVKRKQSADIGLSLVALVGGVVLTVQDFTLLGTFLVGAGMTFSAWNFVKNFFGFDKRDHRHDYDDELDGGDEPKSLPDPDRRASTKGEPQ